MCGERVHLIGSISLSSPPVAGVWWARTLNWLYLSLSSPPVAGVWWGHWRRCPVAAVASSKWMLHTCGDWGETPHMILKSFGCTAIHNKALHKYIIHSLICSQCCRYEFWAHCTDFAVGPLKITFSGGWSGPTENIVLTLLHLLACLIQKYEWFSSASSSITL